MSPVCLEPCSTDPPHRLEDSMCYMLWYAYAVCNFKKSYWWKHTQGHTERERERETRCSTRQEEREIDRYIKMHGV